MNRSWSLVALSVVLLLQAIDVVLRTIAGSVPVLGVCVLVAVAGALAWVATRRQ